MATDLLLLGTNPRSAGAAAEPTCRACATRLTTTFVDLGKSPLCESFLPAGGLNRMEPFYPLHAYVCERCFLVQLEALVAPEGIFREYAYFSSYSESWLRHAANYVDRMVSWLDLGEGSQVVELGSNDGYLLQYFLPHGVPVLGIEPARNVAEAAMRRGVPTRTEFFGESLAEELRAEGIVADLIIGNNVLAQTPDLMSFVRGMKTLLGSSGTITMEFPHLLRLVEQNQFDTIYHEHFSYFSLTSVETILGAQGLALYDVEELPSHGGSLRIYACHAGNPGRVSDRLLALRETEQRAGLDDLRWYSGFSEKVADVKRELLSFLIAAKRDGKKVAGYGAPGKANTLLNYCGIRTDLLDFTVDRNPYKHGMFTPGTHIPIHPVDRIDKERPDYVLILPWNLKDEIVRLMAHVREWGCRFVVPIPRTLVLD